MRIFTAIFHSRGYREKIWRQYQCMGKPQTLNVRIVLTIDELRCSIIVLQAYDILQDRPYSSASVIWRGRLGVSSSAFVFPWRWGDFQTVEAVLQAPEIRILNPYLLLFNFRQAHRVSPNEGRGEA